MVDHYAAPAGGARLGGTAPVTYSSGAAPAAVDADLIVEWDLDGDGDFDDPLEDVTGYVMSLGSMTGRDYPSTLTGDATPGQLNLTLLNTDDRFSFFAGGPLTQAPFSLDTGRRIRVRTAEAPDPDPPLLAFDRFPKQGGLVSAERGGVWTNHTTNTFTAVRSPDGTRSAQPLQLADPFALATLDVGVDDFYAQARWRHVDVGNRLGIAYRVADDDNFAAVYVRVQASGLTMFHRTVTAGVETNTQFETFEARSGDTLGIDVQGTVLTVYLNGVEVATTTAYAGSSTTVGMFSTYEAQRPAGFHELYVWTTRAQRTDGVLWTGYVDRVHPSAELGPYKTAELVAVGPLARAANIDIEPPNSIGVRTNFNVGGAGVALRSPGTKPGQMVGSALARAGLAHPHGPIAEGANVLGSTAFRRAPALDMIRPVEAVDFGFVGETPEGWITYEDPATREARSPQAWFSDSTVSPFGFRAFSLYDWRAQVFNRVEAKVSPKAPVRVAYINGGTDSDVVVAVPDTVNGIAEGDLVIVVIASSIGASGQEWLTPVGWTEFRDSGDAIGRIRAYARKIAAEDIDDDVTFYARAGAEAGNWSAFVVMVKDWFGDIGQGVEVSDFYGYGPPTSQARAEAGASDPSPITIPWDGVSTVMSFRAGMDYAVAGNGNTTATAAYAPQGYQAMTSIDNDSVAMQYATLVTCDKVINPSPFLQNAFAPFDGFMFTETVSIAVRGYEGATAFEADPTIVFDDEVSQASRGVRVSPKVPALFGSEPEAEAYAAEVFDRYSGDRPVIELSFVATASAAYRAQAANRRVGDHVTVQATTDTGMGVDGVFIIENVSHDVSNGGKFWTTTWQLSPA